MEKYTLAKVSGAVWGSLELKSSMNFPCYPHRLYSSCMTRNSLVDLYHPQLLMVGELRDHAIIAISFSKLGDPLFGLSSLTYNSPVDLYHPQPVAVDVLGDHLSVNHQSRSLLQTDSLPTNQYCHRLHP